VAELARILGVSRVTIYNRIKKGRIDARRVGNNIVVPNTYLTRILGKTLTPQDKQRIDQAIRRVFDEYGEVIRRLGHE
jgi:excisionase family DNA binding protein